MNRQPAVRAPGTVSRAAAPLDATLPGLSMTVGTAANGVQAGASAGRSGTAPSVPPKAWFGVLARENVHVRIGVERLRPRGAGRPILRKFHEFTGARTAAQPVPDHGAMRILVTGHRGGIGGPVAAHLERLGHEVGGFDREPWRGLADCSAEARVLGWHPDYTWSGRGSRRDALVAMP
jgi:hypothetical protein